MTGRHRLPDTPVRVSPATDQPRGGSRGNKVIGAITASVAIAGVMAGVAVEFLDPGSPAQPAGQETAPAQPQPVSPQPVMQNGKLIAVGDDWVTAQGFDGVTRTYRITPDTMSLTPTGNHIMSPATAFAVNDEVQIVGQVQGGTAVATTVADREVTGLNGPPMDFVDTVPVSAPTGP